MRAFLFALYQRLTKHRTTIILTLAAVTVFIGFCTYRCSYGLPWYQALAFAFSLFALDTKMPADFGIVGAVHGSGVIYIASAAGFLTSFFTITLVFMQQILQAWSTRSVIGSGDHIVVFGLGLTNRLYIESELAEDPACRIVIIEKDPRNPYLERFRDRGLGILVGEAREIVEHENLNLDHARHCVLSLGSDLANMETASLLQSKGEGIRLFLNIEDRNLRRFHSRGILKNRHTRIYSFYEETARALFERYDIDGEGDRIISGTLPYAIAVVGNTPLAHAVIYQACIMGHLPNENPLTVYCIDRDTDAFEQSVELQFPGIGNVPNITVKYIRADRNDKTFYTHAVWKDSGLTNVILCHLDDRDNLSVASNLAEITFCDAVAAGTLQTRILTALFSEFEFAKTLANNRGIYNNFYAFGRKDDISHKRYIINAERDCQAIKTHEVYSRVQAVSTDDENYRFVYSLYEQPEEQHAHAFWFDPVQSGWDDLSYFKKESSRAVADQMKMKLKALGLRPETETAAADKEAPKRFEKNLEHFLARLKDKELELARMEHNRWNAFHFLAGFEPMPFVSKEEKKQNAALYENRKRHMCLIPFDDFSLHAETLENTLGYSRHQFESYDFLINAFIPQILARCGKRIIPAHPERM